MFTRRVFCLSCVRQNCLVFCFSWSNSGALSVPSDLFLGLPCFLQLASRLLGADFLGVADKVVEEGGGRVRWARASSSEYSKKQAGLHNIRTSTVRHLSFVIFIRTGHHPPLCSNATAVRLKWSGRCPIHRSAYMLYLVCTVPCIKCSLCILISNAPFQNCSVPFHLILVSNALLISSSQLYPFRSALYQKHIISCMAFFSKPFVPKTTVRV